MAEISSLRQHWNSRSVSYDRFVTKGFSNLKERRAWQSLYTEALGGAEGEILDVGCGPGIVSMQLADLGHHVTALDFSEGMLEKARKNATENGLDISFIHGDAMNLPFDDSSFDIIVSDYMLWTVPDPQKVMLEWYRVLRPGGRIVYVDGDWFHDRKMTRFRNRMSAWAQKKDDPLRDGDPDSSEEGITDDLWSFTAVRPETDLGMMREAGFVDITVRHDIQKRVLHGMRYLAHGLTNDHFMVAAYKPR